MKKKSKIQTTMTEIFTLEDERKWTTKDGSNIKIADMNDALLFNTIKHLRRMQDRCSEFIEVKDELAALEREYWFREDFKRLHYLYKRQ